MLVPARAERASATENARVGSLTLHFGDGSEDAADMSGGVIAVYRVASVSRAQGIVYDVEQGQFAESKSVAETLSTIPGMDKATLDEKNAGISSELEWEAARSGMEPLAFQTIEDNKVSFPVITEGLYMVCLPKAADNDAIIHSFLISVPDADGEYDVVAQPKPGSGESPWKLYPPKWLPGGDDDPSNSGTDGDDDGTNKDDGSGGRASTTSAASGGAGGAGGGGTSSNINLRVPQTGDATKSVSFIAAIGLAAIVIGMGTARDRRMVRADQPNED